MKKAPIRVWCEPVDAACFAAIALIEHEQHGRYHAASAWLLLDSGDWQWRRKAEARLRDDIDREHGGRVPYVRLARAEAARRGR